MNHVLLVEDNQEHLAYLRTLLSSNGLLYESAQHGAEALTKARHAPPIIVLSDLLMPVMDGYTLLRQWKSDTELRRIPFVVYTATFIEPDDERLALELGADGFIQKFVEPEVLVRQLRQIIADSEGGASSKPAVPALPEEYLLEHYNQLLARKLGAKTARLYAAKDELQQEIMQRRSATATQASILNALNAHVAMIDAQGTILEVNESWRRHAALNQHPLLNQWIGDNYLRVCDAAGGTHAAAAQQAAAGIRSVLSGLTDDFVLEYSCESAARRCWFQMTVTPLRGTGLTGAVLLHGDITERKLIEQQLAQSESQYLLLLNSTAEGIYRLDSNGVCTFCNATAARLLGYQDPREIVGQFVHEQHHHTRADGTPYPWSECQVYRAFQIGQGTHADDEVFFRPDGSHFPIEYWSYPIRDGANITGTVVTFMDITERQNLEMQFLQSQKMEAVGRLAGGVAHDFNNALQVILTYGELLEEHLAGDELAKGYNQQILAAGLRAASLTRQLLAFSRKQVMRPALLDLGEVTSNVEEMLRRMIGEHIILRLSSDPDIRPISADRSQIEQLLVNLAINARDAMPFGGELSIFTTNMNVELPETREHPRLAPGQYVMLRIRDNGVGMTQATQARIFEPFFTTKEPGKGTGLGLSTVYGIVKQSGGYIAMDSEVGRGTEFRLYFKAAQGVAEKVLPPDRTHHVQPGSETILLIEDEESVRAIIGDTLRSNGYTLLEAPDGKSGIDIARRFTGTIDLLLTDVILPSTSGRGVAEQLRTWLPDLKVIYMSGYTDDFIAQHGVINRDTVLLEKPFFIETLLLRVRETLDRRRVPSTGH